MYIIKKINKTVFYISLFMMSVMFSIVKNIADYDLWHRMAVGKIFSQLGHVVYHDIFTYFPSKPLWVDHEWVSGIIFYNIGHYLGDYGILSLKIFLFSILVLIYKTGQLIHPEPDKQRIGFYVITIIAIILGVSSTLRCQAFTYFFFTLWLYVLERVRKGENRLIWIFPVTALFWANMHAGFAAGFGLLVMYAAGEFLNRRNPLKYLGILALCIPVTLFNPYGIKYWVYLKEALTMPRPLITEWYPLNPFESFYKVIGLKIQFLVLFPAILYFFKSRRDEFKKLDWVEVVVFLTILCLSIQHLRHVVFLSIIIGVFGYKYYAVFTEWIYKNISKIIFGIVPEYWHDLVRFFKFSVTYCFIFTLCLVVIKGNPKDINISLELYPTKAAEFIKINNLSGNLLVPFNWGSYTLWKLYPQNLIAIDGRYEETYKNEAYLDSSRITFCQKGWEKTLNKYHHDVILMYKNTELAKNLNKLKQWKLIYTDDKAVIFVPADTPDRTWILPNKDEGYYIKTKYENNIDF